MKFKIFLTIVLVSTFLIPSAQAAEKGWRYWGYFQAAPNKTTWTAAMTGPTVDISDGAVEGWAFVFSSDDIPTQVPRVKPNFASICAGVKAQKNSKRIAVVIDFGLKVYAPKGEKVGTTITRCVRTDKKSQGIDVLGQVVKVRSGSSGLICGLKGYPSKECGVEIKTPKELIKK
jgi:hypothetical protein